MVVAITDYAIAASLLHAEIKAQGVDGVFTDDPGPVIEALGK